MPLIDFRNRYFNHRDCLVPHQVSNLLPDGGEICCLTGFLPRWEAFRAFLCPPCLGLFHRLAGSKQKCLQKSLGALGSAPIRAFFLLSIIRVSHWKGYM